MGAMRDVKMNVTNTSVIKLSTETTSARSLSCEEEVYFDELIDSLMEAATLVNSISLHPRTDNIRDEISISFLLFEKENELNNRVQQVTANLQIERIFMSESYDFVRDWLLHDALPVEFLVLKANGLCPVSDFGLGWDVVTKICERKDAESKLTTKINSLIRIAQSMKEVSTK